MNIFLCNISCIMLIEKKDPKQLIISVVVKFPKLTENNKHFSNTFEKHDTSELLL